MAFERQKIGHFKVKYTIFFKKLHRYFSWIKTYFTLKNNIEYF